MSPFRIPQSLYSSAVRIPIIALVTLIITKIICHSDFYYKMMNKKCVSVKPSISDLPDPIISDIISLLPTKSIMSCKLVCKHWCSLINHPKFCKSSNSITVIARSFTSLHLVEPEVDYTVEQINENSCLQLGEKAVVKFNDDWFYDCDLVNSCKGLVCLTNAGVSSGTNKGEKYLVVCNPVMSDYVIVKQPLPLIYRRLILWHAHAGFGFSYQSNQYKVLLICYDKIQNDDDNELCVEAHVCTLGGADEWRHLKNRPPQGYGWYGDAKFLKGVLHSAIVPKITGAASILAFDCEEETFTLMNLPDMASIDFRVLPETLQLTTLQCQLCFSIANFGENYHFAIFVMKEYGVKESWNKLFVVSAWEISRNIFHKSYKPLTYWRNGEVLMLRDTLELVSFDLASNTYRTVTNTGFDGEVNTTLYDPIFLPTKNLIMQGKQSTSKAIE